MKNTDFICCKMFETHLEEKTVDYYPKFREVGIPVFDGGTSVVNICFCPWCGNKFPVSLRVKWFEILDKLDIDPFDANSIPEEMKTDLWWHKIK